MKLYLAAPIFTPFQLEVVNHLKEIAEGIGYEVFSPYHASRDIWKGRAPKDCSQEERDLVLEGNVKNLQPPTRVLLSWVGGTADGKVDTGVAWEMGYFDAVRMFYPFALLSDSLSAVFIDPADARQDVNLMLAGTVDAVLHGFVEVEHTLNLFSTGESHIIERLYGPTSRIAHESKPLGETND